MIYHRLPDGTERDITDVIHACFDIAVGSMDFGSGFLDYPEVIALRAIADLIGAPIEKATPHNWRNWDHDTAACLECLHVRKRHEVGFGARKVGEMGPCTEPVGQGLRCACTAFQEPPTTV